MKAREIFLSSLSDWQKKMQEDEWYFDRLSEEIVSSLTSEQAHQQISDIIEMALEQEDKFLFAEAIELAQAIISKANTTQIPERLPQQIERLTERANTLGENKSYIKKEIHEIKRWYRIS